MQIPHGMGWSVDTDTYDLAQGPRSRTHRAIPVGRPTDSHRDVRHGPVINIDPSTIDINELLK
jgi:hypothetical protein